MNMDKAHTHHSWHNVEEVTKDTTVIETHGFETITIWFKDGSSSHLTIHYAGFKEEEE